MNTREKNLVIGAAAAAALAALWFLAVSPAMDWHGAMRRDAAAKEREIASARALGARGREIEAKWGARQAAGLADPADAAAARMMELLTRSAADSGFALGATSPGVSSPDRARPGRMVWRTTVSGRGTLAQTVDFLRRVESAPAPLRVETCSLESPDPAKDQVQLSAAVATSHAKRIEKAAPAAAAKPAHPGQADGAAAKAVLASAPFGFAAPKQSSSKPVDRQPAQPPPPEESNWILAGIVLDDGPQAVFRHAASGEVRWLSAGDGIARAKLVALADDRVQVAAPGGPLVTIRTGETLAVDPAQVKAAPPPSGGASDAASPAAEAASAKTLSPEAKAVADRVAAAILAANPGMDRSTIPDAGKDLAAFLSFMRDHRQDYRDAVPREEVFTLYQAGGGFQGGGRGGRGGRGSRGE